MRLQYTWITPEIRQRYESAGLWDDSTWLDDLTAWNSIEPGALAVVDDSGQHLTVGELVDRARRLAEWLREEGGVRSADVVSMIVPNWSDFLVVHAGIGFAGAVVNPMITALGRSDIAHVLKTAETKVVFAPEEHRGVKIIEAINSVRAECPSLRHVVTVRAADGSGLDAILDRATVRSNADDIIPDPRSADMVIFTSGTESSPKGVVHAHQTARFDLRAYLDGVLGMARGQRFFMPSPLSHATGLQWGLRSSLYLRSTLVLQDRWDPDRALQLIDEHQCTFTLAATPFIGDLVAAAARASRPNAGRSLRYIASGGAAIPRLLVERVRATFGCPLLSVFGASEAYIATANQPDASASALATDGRALPNTEVAIVDSDLQPMPAGQEGEIVARGPHLFMGYLGDPSLTQRAFHEDWYRFGDLGVLTEDGLLSVTGRIKDIVIRGGQNISVREVEEKLSEHPQVAVVAIVGYPDERLGERCCAFVVPADPGDAPTLKDLVTFLRDGGMATYKLPERLEILPAMPMTATGKQRKVELRELARGLP